MKKFLLASASKAFLKRNIYLLQRRDLQLFTTKSGEEALKLHGELSFDLIYCDIELEDMDGFALCSQIRKADSLKAVPVILTGHNISSDLEKVKQSGASAILSKPIDPLQLVETIGKFTDLKMVRSKRIEVDVQVLIKAFEREFICHSNDISYTGMLIETEHPLALGSRITCQFTLPGSCLIAAGGEVIRSICILHRKNLYGIKFINLTSAYRRAIDGYIDSTVNSRLVHRK